jgi:S-adenosylmethionine synthetase
VVERTFLFTSESVTEGHPDKIADQISDGVLDAALANDPNSRVACETLITTGLVVVAGEMTTSDYIDIPRLVRDTIKGIGYTRGKYGFDADTCGVVVAIDEQSPDIAQGVDNAYEVQHDPGDDDPLDKVGAGDQGMMFGYATDETRELMPLPIMLAHRITRRLSEVRKADVLPYLRPDGKAQVSIRYDVDADGRQSPAEIERVLISTQHRDGLDAETMIKPDLIEQVLRPILPRDLYDEKRFDDPTFVYVNPTGKFVVGGPMGDTGLTGRKIIVDTYGGAAPHGIRRALRREERRRGGARRALPDPGRLRDRRRAPVLDPRRDVRYRGFRPVADAHRGARATAFRPASRSDPARPRPSQADLPEDGRLRALRPRRPRLHVGAHRQGRRAARSGRPRSCDRVTHHKHRTWFGL